MSLLKVGQAVPRIEDRRLLIGAGRFTDDVAYPDLCHGVVVRSPHAHAVVNSVDTSAAIALPGVLTVLTGSDWVDRGLASLPIATGKTRPGGKPMYQPEYPALARNRVRYVGDPVAFVVAETYE